MSPFWYEVALRGGILFEMALWTFWVFEDELAATPEA